MKVCIERNDMIWWWKLAWRGMIWYDGNIWKLRCIAAPATKNLAAGGERLWRWSKYWISLYFFLTSWIRLLSLDFQLSHFQGDFHVVEYLGWETTYTEIVPSDRWDISKTTTPQNSWPSDYVPNLRRLASPGLPSSNFPSQFLRSFRSLTTLLSSHYSGCFL